MFEHDNEGYIRLSYRTRFPVAFGHEFSGEVVEVGTAVKRLQVGTPVSVEAMNYCGACRACRLGYVNQCAHCEDNGFTIDGGSAQFIVTRERYCWSLEPLIDKYTHEKIFEVGALMEPTSISYNALFTNGGGLRPGQNVAIFGCGPIGLLCCQLVRAAGAGIIIAFDTNLERRTLALTNGADIACDPAELSAAGSNTANFVLDITNGRGVAMAVETAGDAACTLPNIETCLDLGGKVIIVGLTQGPSQVTTNNYIFRAAKICGSMGHLGGAMDDGIALHAAGRIDTTSIVTARLPVQKGVEAGQRLSARTDGKIILSVDY